MDKKLVIFDWEGTLNDTWGRRLALVAQYAKKMQWQLPTEDEFRSTFKMPLEHAVAILFDNKSLDQKEHLLHYVQENLWHSPNKVVLFPGVRACLQELRAANKILAIASNKAANTLQKAIASVDLTNFFSIIVSASETQPKPATQMLEVILEKCALRAENAIMVGDSDIDVLMAKKLGISSIAFDYYKQHTPDVFLKLGASKVINNINELMESINNL